MQFPLESCYITSIINESFSSSKLFNSCVRNIISLEFVETFDRPLNSTQLSIFMHEEIHRTVSEKKIEICKVSNKSKLGEISSYSNKWMELRKNINWIYLYNVTSRHDEKWISCNNRRCWEGWHDWQASIRNTYQNHQIPLYPKKTVRSTAGFIRYLASTIVQLNFHSHRRIRILEIFHYRIKIPCKILIFDGNEIQKLQTPRNLKIHLSFKVNFLQNRKFYHIFSI